MRWSKIKANLDELRAPSLVGRLELYSTRYRHAHDDAGRAWVTFDGAEILNFSDLSFEREYYGLAHDIRRINDPQKQSRAALWEAYDHARHVTQAKGNIARFDFAAAAVQYLTLTIDQALDSDHPLIRAFAIIDRRIGKRRLRALAQARSKEHPVVDKLLEVRCSVEGVFIPSQVSASAPREPGGA